MPAVVEQIRHWASDLKYWEQMALEMIVSGQKFGENNYQELLDFCMHDAGLVQLPSSTRPKPQFPHAYIPVDRKRFTLLRLFGLTNVNAIPPDQELVFSEQLTLIYGGNGSGKTGFARPLGCAAFARGQRDVLPNVISGANSSVVPHAKIDLSCDGSSVTVEWHRGKRCAELAGFYVFDSTSATAHVLGTNAINFSPSGLSLLTRLVEITDEVRARLRKVLDTQDLPNNFSALFRGMSPISIEVQNLNSYTNLAKLDQLAALKSEEELRITEVQAEIYRIRSRDTPKEIALYRRRAWEVRELLESLGASNRTVSDSAATEVQNLHRELDAAMLEAQHSGAEQFRSPEFSQIGTEAWRDFISAAKLLADAEIQSGDYPSSGDHCLLCRQPLPDEALNLIRQLWHFLSSDAAARMKAADLSAAHKAQALVGIDFNYFAENASIRRTFDEEFPELAVAIQGEVATYKTRRDVILTCLNSGVLAELPIPELADRTQLNLIIEKAEKAAHNLERQEINSKLQELTKELTGLEHRRILRDNLTAIKAYIETKHWIAKGRQGLGSTQNITTKYNSLFEELVTDKYIDLFQSNLEKLKPDLKMSVEMHGKKGEKVRQIVLDKDTFDSSYAADAILSEGEFRAVALADFLSEASLDDNCSGIILDDPVNSLDVEMREAVARLLAEFAKTKQVIIFTHDLVFLYHIKNSAHNLSIGARTHWIQKRASKPGIVFLDNSPVCEKDFKKPGKAWEFYKKAKDADPEAQEEFLKQGFGSLRTTYEAFVMYTVFNEVAPRWGERVSGDRMKDVRVDKSLAKDIADRIATLSRFIDAHLHSDEFASQKPTAELLLKELKMFEEIQKKHKHLISDAEIVSKQDTVANAGGGASVPKETPVTPNVAKVEAENRLSKQLRTRN